MKLQDKRVTTKQTDLDERYEDKDPKRTTNAKQRDINWAQQRRVKYISV